MFESKEISFQDYELYFLRTTFSWSLLLNGGTNLNFLNVKVSTMHESLRSQKVVQWLESYMPNLKVTQSVVQWKLQEELLFSFSFNAFDCASNEKLLSQVNAS